MPVARAIELRPACRGAVHSLKPTWYSGSLPPLILLLLALSTVFLFGGDRDRFYRPGHHDRLSSGHMVVAVNLSPEHNFLMFRRLAGPDAVPSTLYNRFPVGGYALISLATLPFRDDPGAQLYAARMLMLAFFAAAAVAAYCAMSRLASSRWIALTTVLLSFSSYYCLYYNDMVSTEAAMDLFGVLLTFHGTVVFLQEGRFRQMLVKACAALLLGWHVLALILAFVVLGMAGEIVRMRSIFSKGRRDESNDESPVRAAVLPRARVGRYLTFGVVPLLLAVSLLAFNFTNEYAALDGKVAWTSLPSFRTAIRRMGLDKRFSGRSASQSTWSPYLEERVGRGRPRGVSTPSQVAWGPFLEEQLRRIVRLSVPFTLERLARRTNLTHTTIFIIGLFIIGTAVLVVCSICLVFGPFGRLELPLAALVSSGFLWALPMRHNTAFHDHESLFYIGIPLVVFAAGAASLRRLSGRLLAGLSGAAVLIFVLSSAEMSQVGYDDEAAGVRGALIADFEAIRRLAEGKVVHVPTRAIDARVPFAGAVYALHYHLPGSMIHFRYDERKRDSPCRSQVHWPGFVLTTQRVEGATLLTPENRLAFLYDRADYDRHAGSGQSCRPPALLSEGPG